MPERQILSLDEFKRRALSEKDGKRPGALAPGSFIIRSGFTVAAQPVLGEDRRITFVVATGEVNRNGWRLNPQGWELAAYAKCPVMLWAHDDAKLPIANAEKVWVDGDLLKVTSLFTPATMSAFNDTVFEMYRQGFLHAVSAGWIPLEWEFVETETGWEIMCARQELVEISFVPVPAEPNALRQAAKAGIDIGPLRAWARGLAGEPRYAMHVVQDPTRERAEQIRLAFTEFYPGAKLLFVPSGMTLCALEDLAAVKHLDLDEFEREVAAITGGRVTAGVSPRNVSTELADKNDPWSGPTLADFTDGTWDDLGNGEKRDIAGHFAWAAEMPPAAYGSLKLPHHRPSDGKVVWRGCTAAMSRCMQPNTSIPDEDRRKVYNHLAAHYRAFEEEPPEYASVVALKILAPAGTPAPETDDSSLAPAAGAPAATDEPDAISVALARYNRRIKVLEL